MADEKKCDCDGCRLKLPCPHSRPSWHGCPHCLGLSGLSHPSGLIAALEPEPGTALWEEQQDAGPAPAVNR